MTITPSSTATPAVTPTPTDAVIAYDQSVIGTVTDDRPQQRYLFTAQAGDLVTIRLNALSDELDPLLILLGPDRLEIDRNDDADNTTFDSLLQDILLPASGTYTIIATRYGESSGSSQGEFRLTLNVARPTPTPQASAIAFGDALTGRITNETPEVRYTFQATVGDVITIDMTAASGNLDSYLILLDADGVEIAHNDDWSPLSYDARIIDFTIGASGTYTIVATRYQQQAGTTTGTFTLSLNQR
jgi:hypothetical protein